MADKKVQVTLDGPMKFRGTTSGGHTVVMDAALSGGGDDSGPRPTELLLMALGGCTGMDVISILRKKRQDVTGFEMNVSGAQAGEHPHRFTDITIEYVVYGNNIDPLAVARAIELSEEKYCSVSATLKAAARIRTTYRVEPAQVPEPVLA